MKKFNLIMVLSLLLILLTGIVEASYPIKVVDDLDNLVIVSEKPMRIVSLAPSHTEILFALGLEDRIVGRTDYCDYPAEASKITSVGGYSQPSVETIMAVQPDLVFASFGNPDELLNQLRELGIPVLGYDPQTLEDTMNLIWEMSKVTGTEEKATELIANMRERINVVKTLVKDADRPLVFWEVWHDPLYTAGSGTFIDDLITIAGGVNLAADTQSPWPVYNLEVLLMRNPDVYIATQDQWSSPGNIPERPGFDQLKAVQTGRVYIVDANPVNRPGPRLIDGLEMIVRAIHPELFE